MEHNASELLEKTTDTVRIQLGSVEKLVAEKMRTLASSVIGKVESASSVEPRLRKLIVDLDEKFVRLRQDINPLHEILRSLKTKAEANTVEQQREELAHIQSEVQAFKFETEKSLLSVKHLVKDLVPLVNELYAAGKETMAARQSNCLVCGRKGSSSPGGESRPRRESPAGNEEYSSPQEILPARARRNGRNLAMSFTVGEDSQTMIAKSHSFVLNGARHYGEDHVPAVVKRANAKAARCATAMGGKKKYNLPLSYQVLNERYKESSGQAPSGSSIFKCAMS